MRAMKYAQIIPASGWYAELQPPQGRRVIVPLVAWALQDNGSTIIALGPVPGSPKMIGPVGLQAVRYIHESEFATVTLE